MGDLVISTVLTTVTSHPQSDVPSSIVQAAYPAFLLPSLKSPLFNQFAEQVRAVWKDNPLWFAPCYEIENLITEGYWGQLRHEIYYDRHKIYFLGHTKSEVIPNMRTCLAQRGPPVIPRIGIKHPMKHVK